MKHFLLLALLATSSAFAAVNGPYTVVDNGSNTKEVAPAVTIVQTLDGNGNRINLESGSGGASAANQTAIQANAGSDATKAASIQGITGGKAVPVSGTFWQATQPVSVANGADSALGSTLDAPATSFNGTAMSFLKLLFDPVLNTSVFTQVSGASVFVDQVSGASVFVDQVSGASAFIDPSTQASVFVDAATGVGLFHLNSYAAGPVDANVQRVVLPYDQTPIPVWTRPDVATQWSYAAASGGIVNSTTAVTIKAAGGGSVVTYITSLQISADALGVATEVVVRAGAGGTVIWRTKIPTAGLAPLNITFPVPLLSGANQLLEVATLTATVTGGVYVNAQGMAY